MYFDKAVEVLEKPYEFEGKVEPYPFGFLPTFHQYRIHDLESIKEPQRIFVCSMADLFGAWVPFWIIESILEACRRSPQHKYLFLTKNPRAYGELLDEGIIKAEDKNFWLGTTATVMPSMVHWNKVLPTFISCEPIMGPWPDADYCEGFTRNMFPKWVILGAETGNRKNKVVPKKDWIEDIVKKCRIIGAKVFMKDSLIPIVGEENMIREFPEDLIIR
jgi:protein gp37